ALLELRRHPEVREDHQENKNVVDCEGLLDAIACEKLKHLVACNKLRLGIGPGATQVPPKPPGEYKARENPGKRPEDRLTHRDLVRALPVHGGEVDEERDHHDQHEEQPHEWRTDGCHWGEP